MQTFQHTLWGYQLSYPDNWVHRALGEIEGFAPTPEALEEGPGFAGGGHLLVRADWNGMLQPIEKLWGQHLAHTAGFIGAKNIGSAEWEMGGASGFEAEIVLPKRADRRLWAGILAFNFIVLQVVLEHPREERPRYQEPATEILKSLRFLRGVEGVLENACGFPVPPRYRTVPARSIVPDVPEDQLWEAYSADVSAASAASAGALQAFFLRETQARGWKLQEMAPHPGPFQLGFARLRFEKEGSSAVLGIMPRSSDLAGPADIVIRFT